MSHPYRIPLNACPRAAGSSPASPVAPFVAAVAACLLSACGGGGGGSASDAFAPSDATPAAGGPLDGVEPGTLYDDAAGAALAGADLLDAVVGAPGATVDCAATLPCRWVGADAGFAVTVLRADNTGRDGRFEMRLRIDSTHDTTLGVALAGDAIGAGGSASAPVRVALGDEAVTGTRALAAGERLDARIDFDAPVAGATLPGWSLLLDDNGTARPAAFANLPAGPLAGDSVDCAGLLPCTWTSDDGFASIELVGAGGFASERRLHVDLRVTAQDTLSIAAGPETSATGAGGGGAFRARTQRLGTSIVSEGVGVPVPAGVPVDGRIDFFRAPGAPAMLDALVLDLYRDAPVPRWRPRFANVPALAP